MGPRRCCRARDPFAADDRVSRKQVASIEASEVPPDEVQWIRKKARQSAGPCPNSRSLPPACAVDGLVGSIRLPVLRTVIYRSCQARRQGTQAEGALPATVAPAGEVRGTGRQARPFLFGGLGNLLRSAPAKPSSDVSRAD
jgi:hypothetical protein